MSRTITWGELITIVLFLLGAALLFYLVLAAANLVRALRNVNKMVDKIKPNLEKTMDELPGMMKNVSEITSLLKDNMENITKVMDNVGKISDTAKSAADVIQKDIIIKAKGLIDVADGVRRYFVKKKESKENSASGKPSAKTGNSVYRYTYRKGQEHPDVIIVEKPSEATDGIHIDESDIGNSKKMYDVDQSGPNE